MDNSWNIKVADFGLSRTTEEDNLNTLGRLRGTFAYTAPEVLPLPPQHNPTTLTHSAHTLGVYETTIHNQGRHLFDVDYSVGGCHAGTHWQVHGTLLRTQKSCV